jgi:hypothetical protein
VQYLEGLTATYMWVRSHMSVRVVPLQYCRGDSSPVALVRSVIPWGEKPEVVQVGGRRTVALAQ